ncbi:MAG: hypothetical protein ABSE73_13185 [Planctomycetota bacterium]
MATANPQPEIPGSQPLAGLQGPLHLQRFLAPCSGALSALIRSSAPGAVSAVLSLQCRCMATREVLPRHVSGLHLPPLRGTDASIEKRTSVVRRRNIESQRVQAAGATAPSPAGGPEACGKPEEEPKPCCFFSLQLNDEEGVVHAYCRRCNRKILVYDRALYWGTKRQLNETPPTYPYQCSCGGHTFEIALGFEYLPEALDENDIETITTAVRCAGCSETAVVFADEAT